MLLYGFGSKRALLERFAAETLLDGGVLAVNGLFPGLSARALLLRVAGALRLPRQVPILVGHCSLGGRYSHTIRTQVSSRGALYPSWSLNVSHCCIHDGYTTCKSFVQA